MVAGKRVPLQERSENVSLGSVVKAPREGEARVSALEAEVRAAGPGGIHIACHGGTSVPTRSKILALWVQSRAGIVFTVVLEFLTSVPPGYD